MKETRSYSGHDANGTYHFGENQQRTAWELVVSYWPQGWRDLVVRESNGELSAYIETDGDGVRTYWSREQDQHKKKGK